MKKIISFLIAVFIIFLMIPSCEKHIEDKPKDLIYEGNVNFSENNINSFGEILLNLYGKEVINGDVSIYLYFDGLNVLKSIKKVTGDIRISDLSLIDDLSFFSNLEEIGGQIYISNNENLVSLCGLDNLTKVESLLLIENNSALNLSTIKDIEISNYLFIDGIIEEPIPEFKNIVHLKELRLSNICSINSLNFLPNLEKVDRSINLLKSSITSLEGLNKLNFIGVDLRINNNLKLKNLNGLNNLETILGSLHIIGNPNVISIEGLRKLKIVKDAVLIHDTKCTNLNGLENLETKWLAIGRNSNLYDFCAIKPLIIKNDSVEIRFWENMANPTKEEIKSNCP